MTGDTSSPLVTNIKTEPLEDEAGCFPGTEQSMDAGQRADRSTDHIRAAEGTTYSSYARDDASSNIWLRNVIQSQVPHEGMVPGSHSSQSQAGPYNGSSNLFDLLERGKSTNASGRAGIQPGSPEESDYLSTNYNRGPTRLRRLLQGEDVTMPPLEVWKNRDLKRSEDMECARSALKYFLGRHRSSLSSTSADESVSIPAAGDTGKPVTISELVLKCTFCDYANSTEEDMDFIQHMFSHLAQGDFDVFNSTCPKCSVAGLPNVEFVCHTFSHCICSVEHFRCSLCNLVAAEEHILREHILLVHGIPDVKSEKAD